MDSSITVFIGHRGTGKSSLAQRVKHYYENHGYPVRVIDLDETIAEGEKKSIEHIFREKGEGYFRERENHYFSQIVQSSPPSVDTYIVAGAGFIPDQKYNCRYLWIKRLTDGQGRLFLNRPRLDSQISPLEEFKNRYDSREKLYRDLADEVLVMQEGFDFENDAEESYFLNRIANLGGSLTILPDLFRRLDQISLFIKRRLTWGVKTFELRDDLLSLEQMNFLLSIIPKENVLFSFRHVSVSKQSRRVVEKNNLAFDWPVAWGACSWSNPLILSHSASCSELDLDFQRIAEVAKKHPSALIQLEAPIENFLDLAKGHEWQQQEPKRRSFFPTSPNGRWRWYHLRMQSKAPLQFWQEGAHLFPDRPYLLEYQRKQQTSEPESFAAILGDPVEQSRTPGEQYKFFLARGLPVFSIQMSPEEWQAGGFTFLGSLGLRYAAVTSPLKELAYSSSEASHSVTHELRAANTLLFDQDLKIWRSTNTDLDGLQSVVQRELPGFDQIAVWGGGGTLEVLKKVFPRATFYSARSGLSRSAGELTLPQGLPQVVVWAVGRKNWEISQLFPPQTWNPQVVFDLNYSENSPGLEYAMKVNARYISGMNFFMSQAEKQRAFWQ